jgi:hypothetical protein
MLPAADAAGGVCGDSGSQSRPAMEVTVNDTTWSGPNRVRTSDTEREQVATILRAAMAEGSLNLEEGEERLGAAYAAKFRDEFAALTADLPGGGRKALAETPEAQAAMRRGIRRHAGFVFFLAFALTGLWVLSGAHFFWPAIPLAFLIVSLVKHRRYARHGQWTGHPGNVAPWNAPNYR